MFASIDRPRSRRRVWLAALLLYGVAAGLDVMRHLADDLYSGNQAIEFPEIAVAFSAGLFWPVDLIAKALLSMR
jgi:hypothetical protein